MRARAGGKACVRVREGDALMGSLISTMNRSSSGLRAVEWMLCNALTLHK